VAQQQLEHKADVDAKTNDGQTALYITALGGHETVVRQLLEHKADVYAKNNNGWTALQVAARAGREAVMRLLESKTCQLPHPPP
jgi:ankyrin repeat protein